MKLVVLCLTFTILVTCQLTVPSTWKIKPSDHVSDSSRYYNNSMPDYVDGAPLYLAPAILEKMSQLTVSYLDLIQTNIPVNYTANGFDVFEGSAGTALMYLKLFHNYGDQKYLDLAKQYIDVAVEHVKDDKGYIGFLRGPNGVWSVCSVVNDLYGDEQMRDMCVEKLQDSVVLTLKNKPWYDELDTGKAGLIMSCLFVNDYFGKNIIPRSQIVQVGNLLFQSGVDNSKDGVLFFRATFSTFPQYGQNHGSTGVLMQFFRLPELMHDPIVAEWIKRTIDHFVEIQFPSGNYPEVQKAPFPTEADILLQWCHGSPAFIPVISEAYKFYAEQRYLDSLNRAADDLWARGLLTKGLMFCHGISGNTYMMLYLYQHADTRPIHLYRALKFQEFVITHAELSDPQQMRQPTPSPYLFFGSSVMNAIILWSDLIIQTQEFNMPAFSISL